MITAEEFLEPPILQSVVMVICMHGTTVRKKKGFLNSVTRFSFGDLQGLKYLANQRRYFDKLVDTAVLLLAKCGGTDCGFSLSSTIVNYILQRDGVDSARLMYKRWVHICMHASQVFHMLTYL